MKYEKSCGSIIIFNEEVLIIKQNNGDYGFPKGHMEKGETEIETAFRETKEEVNLNVVLDENRRYMITYKVNDNIIKDVVYFVGTISDKNNLKIDKNELKDAFFVKKEEVINILTHNNLKELWNNVLGDMQK